MSPERLQARDYLVIALIIVVFSGASLAYQNTQHFTFDQLQMLLKQRSGKTENQKRRTPNDQFKLGVRLYSWQICR